MTLQTSTTRTVLDAVNPVTRLVMGFVLAIPLLFTLDWVSGVVVLAGIIVGSAICGVPMRTLAKRAVPLLIAALLAGLSMSLYGDPGGSVYFRWGLIHVTEQSVSLAIAMALRVLCLGLPAIALFTGVDSTELADGLAQVWRLPSRFVLGSLAGFRMIAVFADDWRTIGLARRARGLDDTGRVRRMLTMAFGLLVVALRRGTRLATAMEARGFGAPGVRRTWARPSTVGWRDAVGVLICAALMTLALLTAWHVGTFRFVGS